MPPPMPTLSHDLDGLSELDRTCVSQTRSCCGVRCAHRSWVRRAPRTTLISNERLEFLGDAVLGWMIADIVVPPAPTSSPKAQAHRPAQERGERVNALAEVAAEHRPRPEPPARQAARARRAAVMKPSILSVTRLEAVLGAVYIDGGNDAAVPRLVDRLFTQRHSKQAVANSSIDSTSRRLLQELASSRLIDTAPEYVPERRPDPTTTRPSPPRSRIAGRTVAGEGDGSLEEDRPSRRQRRRRTPCSALVPEPDPA
jgi:ribonuclease-3